MPGHESRCSNFAQLHRITYIYSATSSITMPTPTTDFSIFDGQELVTYEPVSGPTVNDVPAVRRPLTQSRQRNVERYIELEPTDVVFISMPRRSALGDLAAGDTITDAESVTYSVLFVERQTLNNTWSRRLPTAEIAVDASQLTFGRSTKSASFVATVRQSWSRR